MKRIGLTDERQVATTEVSSFGRASQYAQATRIPLETMSPGMIQMLPGPMKKCLLTPRAMGNAVIPPADRESIQPGIGSL